MSSDTIVNGVVTDYLADELFTNLTEIIEPRRSLLYMTPAETRKFLLTADRNFGQDPTTYTNGKVIICSDHKMVCVVSMKGHTEENGYAIDVLCYHKEEQEPQKPRETSRVKLYVRACIVNELCGGNTLHPIDKIIFGTLTITSLNISTSHFMQAAAGLVLSIYDNEAEFLSQYKTYGFNGAMDYSREFQDIIYLKGVIGKGNMAVAVIQSTLEGSMSGSIACAIEGIISNGNPRGDVLTKTLGYDLPTLADTLEKYRPDLLRTLAMEIGLTVVLLRAGKNDKVVGDDDKVDIVLMKRDEKYYNVTKIKVQDGEKIAAMCEKILKTFNAESVQIQNHVHINPAESCTSDLRFKLIPRECRLITQEIMTRRLANSVQRPVSVSENTHKSTTEKRLDDTDKEREKALFLERRGERLQEVEERMVNDNPDEKNRKEEEQREKTKREEEQREKTRREEEQREKTRREEEQREKTKREENEQREKTMREEEQREKTMREEDEQREKTKREENEQREKTKREENEQREKTMREEEQREKTKREENEQREKTTREEEQREKTKREENEQREKTKREENEQREKVIKEEEEQREKTRREENEQREKVIKEEEEQREKAMKEEEERREKDIEEDEEQDADEKTEVEEDVKRKKRKRGKRDPNALSQLKRRDRSMEYRRRNW
jgi:hypothetical protein